jgi:hypothetical protein
MKNELKSKKQISQTILKALTLFPSVTFVPHPTMIGSDESLDKSKPTN